MITNKITTKIFEFEGKIFLGGNFDSFLTDLSAIKTLRIVNHRCEESGLSITLKLYFPINRNFA